MEARRRAVEKMLEQRPSKPLETGQHMLLAHALRCRCQVCDRILRWEDFDSVGTQRTICCKREYLLKTHTVKVTVTPVVEERSLLDPMRGSAFPSNDTRLRLEGESD